VPNDDKPESFILLLHLLVLSLIATAAPCPSRSRPRVR